MPVEIATAISVGVLSEIFAGTLVYVYAIFSYDANGMPYSVKNYDGWLDVERTYLYITNLQGDVLSVIDSATGETAVSYTYDAWGKLIKKDGTSSDYASIYGYNPLTYRGYIYDSETGFYYLQSRYYDPSVGRFLNADDTAYLGASGSLLSLNLFAYCENDPVNGDDPTGNGSFLAIGLQLVINVGILEKTYRWDGKVDLILETIICASYQQALPFEKKRRLNWDNSMPLSRFQECS